MATALENSQRKAWALAPFLHRRGMSVADVLRLPRTIVEAGDRNAATQNSLARAAYGEAGVVEEPPHGRDSGTWTLTADLLAWMAANPGADRVPPVDMAGDRTNWLPPIEDETEDETAPIEEEPCPTTTPQPPAYEAADTTSTRTTSTVAASPTSDRSRLTRGGNESPARAAGSDHPASFPRNEGADCTGCGTWHRRYGPHGGGALCPSCRTVALGAAS